MIWSILGIDQTDDPRAIKAAYAGILKTIDREQNPDQFMALHSAYKQALAGIKQPATAASSQTERQFDDADKSTQVNPLIELPDAESHPLIERIDSQLERVSGLLSHSGRLNKLSAWYPLRDDPELLDPEYRHDLGNKVFQLLAEHQSSTQTRRSAARRIPSSVVTLCNDVYGWVQGGLSRETYLQASNPDAILELIDTRPTEVRQPTLQPQHARLIEAAIPESVGRSDRVNFNQFNRLITVSPMMFLMTLIIDAGLVMTPMILLSGLNASLERLGLIGLVALYLPAVLFTVAVQDASVWQRSIGKWMLNYRVIDTNRESVSVGRLFWFYASLCLYLWVFLWVASYPFLWMLVALGYFYHRVYEWLCVETGVTLVNVSQTVERANLSKR